MRTHSSARLHRRTTRRVVAVVAAGGVLAACGNRRSPYMFDARGSEAHRVAGLWWLMFALAAGVYAVVGGFILVAALRGRGTPEGRASRITENAFIWLGGLLVPTAILMVLAVVTVQTTSHLRRPERDPLRIEVVGKRWWWQVRYPAQRFTTANEVHVPVGRPVEIGIDSDNVIHSFWVPQLGGKVDTIPGQHNVWRFRATRAGTYLGECAEYCGVQHANMRFLVVAEPAAAFDRWVARHLTPHSAPTSDLTEKGQLVFLRETCAGCHTVAGTTAQGDEGPDLTDFGSRLAIGADTVPNDPGNLAGWIADPQSIKPGILMPPTPLEPGELHGLVAYLESLR